MEVLLRASSNTQTQQHKWLGWKITTHKEHEFIKMTFLVRSAICWSSCSKDVSASELNCYVVLSQNHKMPGLALFCTLQLYLSHWVRTFKHFLDYC